MDSCHRRPEWPAPACRSVAGVRRRRADHNARAAPVDIVGSSPERVDAVRIIPADHAGDPQRVCHIEFTGLDPVREHA